ncbi:hypothetical protein NMG60_11001664 [Bertholletia excelsa]
MALVSGGRSSLNPNAPLFVPAAVRQVEDFSPEWWDLVTTSAWFHDYWLSQHKGEDGFYGSNVNEFPGHDVADLLPDTIDEFEEFFQSPGTGESAKSSFSTMKDGNAGLVMDAEALMKDLSLSQPLKSKSPNHSELPKYWEQPPNPVSIPRFIQQPR